jgi:hypothetical protein
MRRRIGRFIGNPGAAARRVNDHLIAGGNLSDLEIATDVAMVREAIRHG